MSWIIYGANGYTGELIAREAVARGHVPILAGRSHSSIAALADKLECPYRVFVLDDKLTERIGDVDLVCQLGSPRSSAGFRSCEI